MGHKCHHASVSSVAASPARTREWRETHRQHCREYQREYDQTAAGILSTVRTEAKRRGAR
jgi:hypothetical protein